MSKVFEVNRKLINHNFESYRIISDGEGRNKQIEELSYALPGRALGAGINEGSTLLGYKETKDRATAKYIIPSKSDQEAAYIDENGFVILITVDDEAKPSFRPIFKFQKKKDAGLPGLVSLSGDIWLVSDGGGRLYAFKVQRRSGLASGTAFATWSLKQDDEQSSFRVLLATYEKQTHTESNNVKLLLQHIRKSEAVISSHPGIGSSTSSKGIKPHSSKSAKTSFELILASVEIPQEATNVDDGHIPRTIDIHSAFALEDIPLASFFDKEGNVILFSEILPAKLNEELADAKNKNTDETAPIEASFGRVRIPPYAWTQTAETVTVVFKLPDSIDKKDMNCRFTRTNIDLLLASKSATVHETGNDVTSLEYILEGRFAQKRLWSDIDAESSIWTIEKASKGEKYSLLTLHLEKLHHGTRWSNVFKERDMGEIQSEGYEDDGVEEVAETLNPSDLLNMLDGLQKYTSEQDDNPGQRNTGGISLSGQPVSLLQDGLEEEDAEVGQPCIVSRLNSAGSFEVLHKNVTLLATPLAHSSAITIRQDLDGLVFEQEKSFKHIDTIPALSYVLASKRNANRVHVFRDAQSNLPTSILAFDSLTGAEGQGGAGNLFIYYSPLGYNDDNSPKMNDQGQSRVIRLGSGVHASHDENEGAIPSGPLIDVTMIKSKSGEKLLLVLCQERILIIRNIL